MNKTKTLSLGVQSEYVVSHHEVEKLDTELAAVFRTPLSPDYYFGNFFALKVPLMTQSLRQWESLFDQAFADLEGIRHRTFIWRPQQSDASAIDNFREAGYEYEESDIRVLNKSRLEPLPTTLNPAVQLRPFSSDADWQQWLDISVALRKEGIEEADFRHHRQDRQDSYRRLVERKLGNFYGAFVGSKLVGYAGVFHWQGLARYQDVRVVPSWQNHGIARHLVHRMASDMRLIVERQVIVADANYHATKLYQSLGFDLAEREASLCLWPRSKAS